MRALIQRVSSASLFIDGKAAGCIDRGLVVFLGISRESTQKDVMWLADKILKLRLFDTGVSKTGSPRSILKLRGGLMIVSQFTLHASTRKGTRPSYHRAATPDKAKPLYDVFVETIRRLHGGQVETGKFGSDMKVQLTNDGPFTLILDSRQRE